MKPGDYFTVSDGDIRIPQGSFVCAWALNNLLPILPSKERDILEAKDDDWMWRVHHAQCPDPGGRVIFKIERVGKVNQEAKGSEHLVETSEIATEESEAREPGEVRDLRIVVEEVKSKCTSGMHPGDFFLLRSGRLTIPADRHFCLYAMQAVLPFLAAKQRRLQDGDWLKDAHHYICPDPAGNVIMRIERYPTDPFLVG